MALCIFDGNTDMYGIGIRLGFYLQWFSAILARFLVPKRFRDHRKEHPMKNEATGLRFSNNLFAAATFLALLILIGGDVSSLQVVEVYVVLLLTFGYSLALVPIYLWRLLTLCSPRWDPTRWPITWPSKVESNLTFLLITGVASFQLWFWFGRVSQLHNLTCQEYGFLMAKVRLNLPVMQAVHILLYFAVLLSCVTMILRSKLKDVEKISKKKGKTPRIRHVLPFKVQYVLMAFLSSPRKNVLRDLSIILSLAVATIVVTAAELTIKWNNIQGVNTLTSAGQTIPFAIGFASFVRVLYVYRFKYPDPAKRPRPHRRPRVSRSESPLSSTVIPITYARRRRTHRVRHPR
jgi:hypothetical protein